jgi:hypothetical protein
LAAFGESVGKIPSAAPIAGLLITIAIFGIVHQSAWAVLTRIINSLAVALGELLMPEGASNQTLDTLVKHGVSWTVVSWQDAAQRGWHPLLNHTVGLGI